MKFANVTLSVALLAASTVVGATRPESGGAAVTTPAGSSCLPVSSDLVAWWPGEGNGIDFIGSNAATMQNGASFDPGEVGQAFSFNGVNQFAQVPDSGLWAFDANDFTIDLWVNHRSVPSVPRILVSNDEGPGFVNKWAWSLEGGSLKFIMVSPSLNPVFLAQTPFAPIINQWHHLAVTRSSGTFTMYIDGVQGTSEFFPRPVPNPNAPLSIGQAEGGGFMNGWIDEVAIHSRALTLTEIQEIYNAGSVGRCKNPVANAGVDPFAVQGTTVVLDGSASRDRQGSPLSYAWTQLPGGSSVTLDLTDQVHPQFTAPQVSPAGEVLHFQLVVTSVLGPSDPDLVDVHVVQSHTLSITNVPSGVPAGPVPPGSAVQLSVAALDTLAHPLTYEWSASCPGLTRNGSFSPATTAQNPLWTAPRNDTGSPKDCTLQVSVSDGQLPALTPSFIVSVLSGPVACYPKPPNIRHWWPGDVSGIDINNISNGGLMNGASIAQGLVGPAFHFDGIVQYVDCGDILQPPSIQSLTMAAWIKSTGPHAEPDPGRQLIVGKAPMCGDPCGSEFYVWWNDGNIVFTTMDDTRHYDSLSTSTPLNYNEWHYVAVTLDDPTRVKRVYVDGELKAESTIPGRLDGHPGSVRIGATVAQSVWPFNGFIDEVQAYSRALTPAEIDGIYDAGPAGVCKCQDLDNDGVTSGCPGNPTVDCDDLNSAVHPGASDDNCNGLDEDCSGVADNGYVATPTTCGNGACASTGSLACIAGAVTDTCTVGTSAAESCNNIDDDCNGFVDDGIAPVGISCGFGACARTGTKTCDGGVLVDHCTAGSPVTETCNGIDDDCDDVIDNGNPGGGGSCFTGLEGVCAAGTSVCSGGHIGCNPNIPPSAETCDGLDNDCNGVVDNGGPGGGSNCNTVLPGVCTAGTTVCSGGHIICISNVPPSAEVCDAQDNNCNGAIDEGVQTTYYRDADGDGYGNPAVTALSCASAPNGYVTDHTDCNDANAAINPGRAELCDPLNADENCDGVANNVAGTRYVNDASGIDGGNACNLAGSPCKTIGQAVLAACRGETVHVAAGNYLESVIIGKALTLEGDTSSTLPVWQCGIGTTPCIQANGGASGQDLIRVRSFAFVGDDIAVSSVANLDISNCAFEQIFKTAIEVAAGQCTAYDLSMTNLVSQGKGIHVFPGAHLTATRLHLSNYQIALWVGGSADVDTTLIAGVGDGIDVEGGSLNLSFSTISQSGGVGLSALGSGTVSVSSSIIWGSGTNVSGLSGSSFSYSDVGSGALPGGTGNISVNPQFRNPAAGDYRLATGSPAADVGVPFASWPGIPCLDLDGSQRAKDANHDGDPRPDMGAYEFTYQPPVGQTTLTLQEILNSLQITLEPVSGATKYETYRSTRDDLESRSTGTCLASSPSTILQDLAVPAPGNLYYYGSVAVQGTATGIFGYATCYERPLAAVCSP